MTSTDVNVAVLISRGAARAMFGEIQRWVEGGLRTSGLPLESLMYPMSVLVPRPSGWRSPLELVGLGDIAEILIDDVAIPPDEAKAFSPGNCHFEAADLARVNDSFNREIAARIERHPRLAINSKLHSHPFAGGAFLSHGDQHYGVHAPAAIAWREARGLRTALLHVAYPDGAPLPARRSWRLTEDGAQAISRRGHAVRWRIRSWGSTADGQLIDLGDARIVGDRQATVRAARAKPYWATRAGARWCDAQKRELRAAGYRVSRNLLGRGWRRYLLELAGRTIVIALPPDLPAAPLRTIEVRRAWCNDFAALPLPRWADPGPAGGLGALSLLRLARHYGAPPRSP